MPPSMKTLGVWFVSLLGFATIASSSVVAAENDSSSQIVKVKTELLAQAILHAQTNMQESDQLIKNIMEGDIDALYSVAVDINAHKEDTADDPADDANDEGKEPKNENRITSMMIWHELADGAAKHAPSALALGRSYETGNKTMALRYFAQASGDPSSRATRTEAQYGGGRAAAELEEYAGALDFYRKCHGNAAAAEDEEDEVASETSEKCKMEYKILSSEIRGERMTPQGGVMGIVKMFGVASLDGFPKSGTPEFDFWTDAVAHLVNYQTVVQKGIEKGDLSMVMEGAESLLTAQDSLDDLRSTYGNGDGMSQLQDYLADRLNILIKSMVKGHEGFGGHDEF
mmetsp:Transcript_32984/g.60467  ORF Transcript_32984/g.60467 Transcript_32984/m.60467 type:complete len:343 (+) Transcript_32984:50-1078(+)